MFEISVETAADYLLKSGRIRARDEVSVSELAGGVSNLVLLVTRKDGSERFVLKQARQRLRVPEEWLCPIERIWREVETLKLCGDLLTAEFKVQSSKFKVGVPEVLWEERENFVYAMTAAERGQRSWKEMLLAGEIEPDLAVACGILLAAIHAGSWRKGTIADQVADRTYFEQLRIEPYYRWIARKHPDLEDPIVRLIESLDSNCVCLVHGDFSPKNLLVWPGHVMLIDFEVGHYGDPAFDLGFFLTHLLLKSLWAGSRGGEYRQIADVFWQTYREAMLRSLAVDDVTELERRMTLNLAGCMLARVDGKSTVDYLAPPQQELVRTTARKWFLQPPRRWEDIRGELAPKAK